MAHTGVLPTPVAPPIPPPPPALAGAGAPSYDQLVVLPLGSGGEVGRSCVVVSYRGRRVMFDCGVHPAKKGLDSLPFFDAIDCETIDLVLITHFHHDHCAALPYFSEQTGFRGRIFMTSATKSFYRMVMQDFIRVGTSAHDIATHEWVHSTLDKVETVEYLQEVTHNGIRFQPFNAGHVLGAAMFMVDIGGAKVLYTGDFSRTPDRHLAGASVPPISPDVLIVESTYGIQVHEPREIREQKLLEWVTGVLHRGGRCLLPVFALGRAQELLLILEEYWRSHRDVQHAKVYFASSMAARSMREYRTFVQYMNRDVKESHDQTAINPFDFRYITPLKDLSMLDDSAPCVVLASPGMLQSGMSMELFERWCGQEANGVVISGYSVEGTPAYDLLSKPRQVRCNGKMLAVRMGTIETVSFSAHSDGRQTREFIAAMSGVQHVILVHGSERSMAQLHDKLTKDFASLDVRVHSTRNQDAITVPFVSQRQVKLLGSLAKRSLHDGDYVHGVLMVSEQNQHTAVHPSEIEAFAGLELTTVEQAMVLPLGRYASVGMVLNTLRSYYAQTQLADEVYPTHDDAAAAADRTAIKVAGTVTVDVAQEVDGGHTTATIAWRGCAQDDFVADVTCVALTQLMAAGPEEAAERTTGGVGRSLPLEVKDNTFRMKAMHHMLSHYYTAVRTDLSSGVCHVQLGGGASVAVEQCIRVRVVEGHPSPSELEQLCGILRRVYLTLFPIPFDEGWCDCGKVHHDEDAAETHAASV